MSKSRQFSIVLHNVKSDSKGQVDSYVSSLQPLQSVSALEPYNDQEGHHVHIFLRFSNPRSFKSVLNMFQNFSTSIVAPRPEGEERSWGRVQVDQMRGSFDQATNYLTSPNKVKALDPSVTVTKRPNPLQDSYNRTVAQHLRRFYGTFHFPDIGRTLQGFQYVEFLVSKDKDVPDDWQTTYDCVKGLEI